MLVFTAEDVPEGYNDDYNFNWCLPNEILMFGALQNRACEVGMLGVQSRSLTTYIQVQDLNLTKDFFKEIMTESVERGLGIKIAKSGKYVRNFGGMWKKRFDINKLADELLEKAAEFKHGDMLQCRGRLLNLRQ